MGADSNPEQTLIKKTLLAIGRDPRLIAYPLVIIVLAYLILGAELELAADISTAVSPTLGVVIPGTCVGNSCQALGLQNIMIIAVVFASTLLVAFVSVLFGMTMYIDFNSYEDNEGGGMMAFLKQALVHGRRALVLALAYTVFIFALYHTLSASTIPFYAPAPIPTYLIVALAGSKRRSSDASHVKKLSDYINSAILIFEKNFVKLAYRFVLLTLLPFLFYSSNIINVYVGGTLSGAGSLLNFLLLNVLRLMAAFMVVISVFALTSVYTFTAYEELRS